MPLKIIRNDITKMAVDAIVCATDSELSGSGGADGSLRRAAGPKLAAACKKLRDCKAGSAKITRGFRLPCKYVIFTVGPRWQGGDRGERETLASCYLSCLELAKKNKCRSLAFPLIASGSFGYPKDRALRTAIDTIGVFLLENDMDVYMVVYDRQAYSISAKLFSDIQTYIDDNYVEENRRLEERGRNFQRSVFGAGNPEKADLAEKEHSLDMSCPRMPFDGMPACSSPDVQSPSLEELVSCLDESFSQMLLRKIDEAGMTDAQCYKRANIDRKLFSKIRSDVNYRPSKLTAIAFAVALELPLEETRELLAKAGFALSRSSKFDIIIEYFIGKGNYNIFEINEALFAFDQSLLGA